MNTRKILAVLCAFVLIVGMTTACGRNRGNEISPLPGGTPGTAGADTQLEPDLNGNLDHESSVVEVDDQRGRYEFSDEHVSIDLSLDRQEYTVNELLELEVTIRNNAQVPIVFTRGSGSNIVPDGLQVMLADLTPMYQPVQATMDMQYSHIAPGESVTYQLPYAPYTVADESLLGPGLDQTLDFFRDNTDYTPAQPGTVHGTLTFTYQLTEGDNDEEPPEGPIGGWMEGDTPYVISGEFTANIADADRDGNRNADTDTNTSVTP